MKRLSLFKSIISSLLLVSFASLGSAQTASFEESTAVYSPDGGSISFDLSFDYSGQSLSTMGVLVDLPTGWSFAGASGGSVPPIVPEAGTTSIAEFAYFSIPSNSIGFTITLNYVAGLTGDQSIGGSIIYKISGDSTGLNAALGPITISAATPPAITSQPESATVISGGGVTFTAAASGTPAPTLQWRKNGSPISGETSASYTINAVVLGDAANYDVVATNAIGSATSDAAILTVHVPVSISVSPLSQTLAVGQSLTLSVQADGFPAPTYQWRMAGEAITGATTATFTVPSVALSDAGDYDVVVTNVVGSKTSATATITVQELPVITGQPTGSVFLVGASGELTVTASGGDALAYQWRKNGGVIPGATGPTLAFAGLTLEDAGTFDVVVSNSGGSVTSDAVDVAIVELTGSHSVAGKGYQAGSALTINNTLTYAGNLTSFGWSVMPPAAVNDQKWTFESSGGSAGQVAPQQGTTDLFEWAWTSAPASPIEFSYTLNVPSNVTGDQMLTAVLLARFSGTELSTMVKPDPLVVPVAPSTHDADTDKDNQISLSELLRVIELYNTKEGTRRTGVYHADPETADGFSPGRDG